MEGLGLQGSKEGVEFVQVGVLAGLLLLDGFDDGGKAVLEVDWRQRDHDFLHVATVEVRNPDPRLDSVPVCDSVKCLKEKRKILPR